MNIVDYCYHYQDADEHQGCAKCINRSSPNNCIGCDGKTHRKEDKEKQEAEQYFLDEGFGELDFNES